MIPADLAQALDDAATHLRALRGILARAANQSDVHPCAVPATEQVLDQTRQLATETADALGDMTLLLLDLCTPDTVIAVPPAAHELAMVMATAHLDGIERDGDFALLSQTITQLLADGGMPMRDVAGLLAAQARLAATLALCHTGNVPDAMGDLRTAVYAHGRLE